MASLVGSSLRPSILMSCLQLLFFSSFAVSDAAAVPAPTWTVQEPRNCSFIDPTDFQLIIIDLEYVQNFVVYTNVRNIKHKTVEQFLTELEEWNDDYAFSSHSASTRLVVVPEGFPPFAVAPPTSLVCNMIEMSHQPNGARQYVMHIGSQPKPDQLLLSKFFRGLLIDNDTGLFKTNIRSPLKFKKSSPLSRRHLEDTLTIDSHIIEFVRSSGSASSSKDAVSVEVSSLVFSAEAKYSQERSYTSASASKRRSAVVSLVSKQVELLVDEDEIEVHPTFLKKLLDITEDTKDQECVRAEKVIRVLNQFGWFASNHFVLGGRLDIQKSIAEDSSSNGTAEISSLSAKVSAKISAFQGGVGAESQHGSSSSNANSAFTADERITSTVNGAIDIQSFVTNVQIEKNWRVIQLKNVVPTFQLLFKHNPHLSVVIRELFMHCAHLPHIKNLQPNVDILRHVNDLWDAYQKPF